MLHDKWNAGNQDWNISSRFSRSTFAMLQMLQNNNVTETYRWKGNQNLLQAWNTVKQHVLNAALKLNSAKIKFLYCNIKYIKLNTREIKNLEKVQK